MPVFTTDLVDNGRHASARFCPIHAHKPSLGIATFRLDLTNRNKPATIALTNEFVAPEAPMIKRRFVCHSEEEALDRSLVLSQKPDINRRDVVSDELRFLAAENVPQLVWRNAYSAREDNGRICSE